MVHCVDKEGKPILCRHLGLFEVTMAGVGIILGAGIYALVGKAAGIAGNAVWLSFLLSAVIATVSGLCYAELASMFPKSGAEYVYIEETFSRTLAFSIGWLMLAIGVFAAAAVAMGFGGYFSVLFGIDSTLAALALVVLMSLVVFMGVKTSTWIAIFLTIVSAIGLFIVIAVGIPYFGSVDYTTLTYGWNGVVSAAALIFFAFIGFESIVRLSEETAAPTKTIPRALFLAIGITTILYVLVAISAVSVLGYEALAASEAPLAEVAAIGFGPSAFLVSSVIALFATSSTVLLVILATSRLAYGMADEKSLPKIFKYVSKRTSTPSVSIFILMVLTMFFIVLKDISFAAAITDYAIFITFFVVDASVIVLRYKKSEIKRMFKVPCNIGKFPVLPVVGMGLIVWLMTGLTLKVLYWGTVLFAIGLIIGHFYEVERKQLVKSLKQ